MLMKTDLPTPPSDLAKAFQFTADDLKLNRQGRLSPTQIARLRKEASRRAIPILLVLGGLGILTILTAPVSSGELFLFLLILGVPAFLTISLTVGLTEAAVAPGLVTRQTGQAHLAYGIYSYNPPLSPEEWKQLKLSNGFKIGSLILGLGYEGSYRLAINDLEFRVSRDEHAVLNMIVYNVYYLPTLRKIVSLEPLDLDIKPARPVEKLLPPPDLVTEGSGDELRG
ncbi:MAG: hypothetical protein KF716_29520 [Anaerolineae bacterium]|nr:hypothetical protein [Anaerolineae bacterium]